jgi:hypothetical protein
MKRAWILAIALVSTLAALGLAMLLGSATFDYRRFSQHEGRLVRVMRELPTAARLTQGLQEEGTVLLATATTREEKEQAVAAYGGRKTVEVRAKAVLHPQMRVYRASDMLYVVFFDGGGVMRDFTCVSR